MYIFALLVLTGSVVFMLLFVPPHDYAIVVSLIGIISMISYVGLYLAFEKKKTALIGGLYMGGLLLLASLHVLDWVNFVLISTATISLFIFFHQK